MVRGNLYIFQRGMQYQANILLLHGRSPLDKHTDEQFYNPWGDLGSKSSRRQ